MIDASLTRLQTRILITSVSLLFLAVLFSREPVYAKNPVSCRYLSSSGKTISLQLNIPSPAPASLILEQHIPQNVSILRTNPPARKINLRGGVVKWLLKGVSPGTQTVSMELGSAIPPGNVRATLRYRSPEDGTMIELSFRP